ncbi:TetR/AcrR family transcriptional regulator [soil metagenome]
MANTVRVKVQWGMAIDPKERRAARHAQADMKRQPSAQGQSIRRSDPITVDRITDAALDIVASKGYDALTMRSVAGTLNTGPASLYAHVVNKADLDELVIGRLCAQIVLPKPDAAHWRVQFADVVTQLRDQYLKYPGISRAALAMVVTNLDVLRVNEGMLAILIVGGIRPQAAAWAMDALFLYVGAYALESSVIEQRGDDVIDRNEPEGHDELLRRFATLPPEEFPQSIRYAAELTSGTAHERFDFTVGLMLDNLATR